MRKALCQVRPTGPEILPTHTNSRRNRTSGAADSLGDGPGACRTEGTGRPRGLQITGQGRTPAGRTETCHRTVSPLHQRCCPRTPPTRTPPTLGRRSAWLQCNRRGSLCEKSSVLLRRSAPCQSQPSKSKSKLLQSTEQQESRSHAPNHRRTANRRPTCWDWAARICQWLQ